MDFNVVFFNHQIAIITEPNVFKFPTCLRKNLLLRSYSGIGNFGLMVVSTVVHLKKIKLFSLS
jgi:hypothetical protein